MQAVATKTLRLGILRLANIVAYSATYVVVPALMFHGTRSATIAGVAFVVEGLIRAVLAMWSATAYARMGSRQALFAAEAIRFAGVALLASSVTAFSVTTLIAGSVLFQFGYSIVALEQELRCTELGDFAVRGQTAFRIAEVVAMPIVLAVSLLPFSSDSRMLVLLGLSVMALGTHLVLARAWYPADFAHAKLVGETRLRQSASYIVQDPLLWRGLVVCTIAFTIFVWSLSGGPFLLAGRHIWGLSMDEPAGIAAFKLIMAVAGGTGAILWGTALSQGRSTRLAIIWSVAAPSFLAVATIVQSDWLAFALLGVMMGAAIGTLSWQRAYRQAAAPSSLRMGMTTLFLSADCIGMALAGIALILNSPVLTGLALSALCLSMSTLAWRKTSAPSSHLRS